MTIPKDATGGCCPSPRSAADDDARIYPCAECGTLRTKAEGGTTFTVCDDCWDKHSKTSALKTLLFLFLFGLIACLSGCQTVNGKKYYVGPKIRFDLNVKGVGIGVTLYDPLNPEDPRIIEINPPKTGGGKEPVK